MLRYIQGDALAADPHLAQTMFRDRARQFHGRLRWNVTVDGRGEERDAYDALNPLYVIWQRPDGSHGGSLRFLPTTGRTMVNDHFLHLTDNVRIVSPHIWECTRFSIAPGAAPQVSAALMQGGLEFGISLDLSHAVGVFDTHMTRVYRALGWPPAILGSAVHGGAAISVGLWAFEAGLRAGLCRRAGVSETQSRRWAEELAAPVRETA